MKHASGARLALVSGAVATLVVASCAVAGASTSTKGRYNANAAKLVPAVYKTGTLQVASDATYAPDESMSGSKVVGFDADLMYAIATTLGIHVKENNATFSGIILGVQTNKYQIGNSSFTDTKAREKQVNFVDYFKAGEGVYAKSSSTVTINGLKSLCGLKVAVETGTVEQTDATNTAKHCASNKKLTVLNYTTQTEADLAVSTGAANVGFLDSQIAGYVVSKSGGVFKLVGSAINVAPYGIATQKNARGLGLAKAIQAALKVLIANGTYHAILAKWGVTAGAVPASKVVLNGAIS
ncbi:MAG TPA: ABC transporter substrate-binding protein [Acidimicrobiales bacterium]|nr:ABC transporter substrate-binding protein [Acidimicrobiales bacterium]